MNSLMCNKFIVMAMKPCVQKKPFRTGSRGVLSMGCVVCSIWGVLSMWCALYGVCSIWGVLSMGGALYVACSIWGVLSMGCALYGWCSLWGVLSMGCALYGVCSLWVGGAVLKHKSVW